MKASQRARVVTADDAALCGTQALHGGRAKSAQAKLSGCAFDSCHRQAYVVKPIKPGSGRGRESGSGVYFPCVLSGPGQSAAGRS